MIKLPPFTLRSKQFPRDVGQMILRCVAGKLHTTNQFLSFLCCRMVCKTWYAMLPITMLANARGIDRTLANLFEYGENKGFIGMTRQLVEWKYPIGRLKRDGSAKFSAFIHLPKYMNVLPLFIEMLRVDPDPPLKDIWKAAIKYGDLEIMAYIAPAVLCSEDVRNEAFSIALYFAREIRVLKKAYILLPPQTSIPLPDDDNDESEATGKRWSATFDFLLEKFGADAINDWQLRLLDRLEFSLVTRSIQHFMSCSEKVCQRLHRFDLYKKDAIQAHKDIANVCYCGAYSTKRKSGRLGKKIKII